MVDISLIPKEFNLILIKENSKLPKGNWKQYKTRIYPRENFKNHNGNVGVHCGKISNDLLIIDWDFKEGKKSYFKTIYLDFLKAFPKLANTYTVETPNGFHFYYHMDDFLESRHSKKYILKNDTEICNITLSEFEKIKEFFLLDKIKKPRKPFIDLMNGRTPEGKVMEIETYSIETGQKEFVYWKNIFREMWHYCGMEPYEVYRFLEMNQPSYNKDKCDVQLQHHPYTVNPLSNKHPTYLMKKYFPNYYTNETVIENTEIILKNLTKTIIFNKDDILKKIEDLT